MAPVWEILGPPAWCVYLDGKFWACRRVLSFLVKENFDTSRHHHPTFIGSPLGLQAFPSIQFKDGICDEKIGIFCRTTFVVTDSKSIEACLAAIDLIFGIFCNFLHKENETTYVEVWKLPILNPSKPSSLPLTVTTGARA